MNILYVSQYFPPEIGAPAARVHELSRHWARAGHQVTVLTGFPNHPDGIVPAEYRPRWRRLCMREQVDGIDVLRTWLLPLPNRKSYERILNYGSFCLSASLRGMFLRSPDVIIATSPQLLVGLAGWWLRAWNGAPFILEVRDLWPESLAAVGVAGSTSLLHRTVGALAGFLYRRCDLIVVVTPAFRQHLVEQWHVPPEKISVVENGVETAMFSPEGARDARAELGCDERFVVAYIGTVGNAAGLGTIIQAAAQLRTSRPEILFLVVGEGAERERFAEQVRASGLENIRLVPKQPRERIPDIIRSADACLVLLRKTEVFKTVIPTKMLEFFSCGRPVILGVDGQARQLMESARAGIYIEPENAAELAAAAAQLHRNPELRRELGANARRYVLQNCSRARTAEDYLAVLQRVASSLTARNCATAS